MAVNIITKEDLLAFKEELLHDLREIMIPANKTTESGKQWLKTWEIKKMLGVSNTTLQSMRNKGTLTYKKVGGLIFYSYADIVKLMQPLTPVIPVRTTTRSRKAG